MAPPKGQQIPATSSVTALPDTICGLPKLSDLIATNCCALSLPSAIHCIHGLDIEDSILDDDENHIGYLPCIASSPLASSLAAVNSRTRRRIARRECIHCDKEVGLDQPRFRFCARCESPYCSEKCQREHWQEKYGHKAQCSRFRKRMRRKCDVCGLQNGNNQPSFPVCGRCGTRRYCSEECQREDWEAGHAQKCVGCV